MAKIDIDDERVQEPCFVIAQAYYWGSPAAPVCVLWCVTDFDATATALTRASNLSFDPAATDARSERWG
jgi:hypothetical protein